MAFLILLGGLFLGFILFMFTFIFSKMNGKYYLASIITLLFAVIIVAYGLFFVGGFEGMAYLFLAAGFFIISIVGALFSPLLIREKESKQFNKRDEISLLILIYYFCCNDWHCYFFRTRILDYCTVEYWACRN